MWEPVKVNGRFYEYRYSHYMDRSDSYVVRYDYIVKGEVISTKPPRLKETVEWSVTWGAPIEGNKEPWLADYNRGGVTEHHIELVARDPKPSVGAGSPEVRDVYGDTKPHLPPARAADDDGRLARSPRVPTSSSRDINGATPLIVAAGFGQRAWSTSCERGGGPEARSYDRRQPLYSAAAWNHLAVVELLIEFGADVNARNKEGLTPFGPPRAGNVPKDGRNLAERFEGRNDSRDWRASTDAVHP